MAVSIQPDRSQNRTEVKPDGARKIRWGERGGGSGPLRLREAPFGGWGGGRGDRDGRTKPLAHSQRSPDQMRELGRKRKREA